MATAGRCQTQDENEQEPSHTFIIREVCRECSFFWSPRFGARISKLLGTKPDEEQNMRTAFCKPVLISLRPMLRECEAKVDIENCSLFIGGDFRSGSCSHK